MTQAFLEISKQEDDSKACKFTCPKWWRNHLCSFHVRRLPWADCEKTLLKRDAAFCTSMQWILCCKPSPLKAAA